MLLLQTEHYDPKFLPSDDEDPLETLGYSVFSFGMLFMFLSFRTSFISFQTIKTNNINACFCFAQNIS